jgi:protein TonB
LRQEGLVRLTVRLDARGQVTAIALRQSSGFRLLDDAAVEAVRAWRFDPARVGDAAVESEIDVPVRFQLVR